MPAIDRNNEKFLCIEGLPITNLSAEFGTPLYVYSARGISEDYRKFQKAVSPLGGKINFAVKANSVIGVLALIKNLGGGADIVSIGEMERAQAAGISPSEMVFSGVGKTAHEIHRALKAGIGQINAESAAEVDSISNIAKSIGMVASVALRINVDVDPKTHKKISTGKRETKFGISTYDDEAKELYLRLSSDPNIKPAGLAVHIGSQICDLLPFEHAYTELRDFAQYLRSINLKVPTLDLGGGLGVDYHNLTSTDFTAYGNLVAKLFVGQGFSISFEPGRSLVANNGLLLTKVIFVKQGHNKRFVIVDAGMNDLIRPTLYDAHHQIVTAFPPEPPMENVDIVGPICETGDYLGLNRKMPKLHIGDELAVLSTGAYGAVMGSNYNSRPLAAEVMVYNGRGYLLRASTPISDMIASETIPDFD